MQRNAIPVSIGGFAILLVSFYGLMFLKSSTQFDDLFPSDSPTVRDLTFIEEHIGPISSIEILLQFPPESDLDVYTQATWIDKITAEVLTLPEIGAVMSANSFLPTLPKSGTARDVARRTILRRKLTEALPNLIEQGWVADTKSGKTWRITTKVSALTIDDYGLLTKKVEKLVGTVIPVQGANAIAKAEFTGLSPVMNETQKMLLRDLGASFTTAFLLITPVMMLIARGFWAGFLIMIPNVLPETLVFGSMAWLGFRLDIAGLLTASVAMGIAVNDTLHFVNWYAHRLSLGDSRSRAIEDTMSNCAVAMVHTMAHQLLFHAAVHVCRVHTNAAVRLPDDRNDWELHPRRSGLAAGSTSEPTRVVSYAAPVECCGTEKVHSQNGGSFSLRTSCMGIKRCLASSFNSRKPYFI